MIGRIGSLWQFQLPTLLVACFFFFFFFFFFLLTPTETYGFDQNHKLFAANLRKYVDGDLVHYKQWKKKQSDLNRYLKSMADLSKDELSKMSQLEKEAFWLNAYNAFTIKLVLDNYPVHGSNQYFPQDSIRQIPDLWEKFSTTIAGEPYTIDRIEHDVLRLQFHDERIHYAVNAAARGSGPLSKVAFVPERLDRDLTACAERFLSNSKNLSIDAKAKTITVSQIFKWFPLDFTKAAGMAKRRLPPPTDDEIVVAYTIKHLPEPLKKRDLDLTQVSQYKVIYRPFDWSLNDADSPKK